MESETALLLCILIILDQAGERCFACAAVPGQDGDVAL